MKEYLEKRIKELVLQEYKFSKQRKESFGIEEEMIAIDLYDIASRREECEDILKKLNEIEQQKSKTKTEIK